MRRSRPLSLELLEDRCVPATWNNPWPDAQSLTLSFARDGTALETRTSDLFAALGSAGSPSVWQSEILRAVQKWVEVANLNVGVVADGGQAFGTPGLAQGDSRFGDLRIAGTALPKDVIGVTSPFDALAGTWSGDVKFNTAYGLGMGAGATYDLFTVALHELGHSFGLGESTEKLGAMYERYEGKYTGLSTYDVSAIQRLYGARSADAWEGAQGNESLATATPLSLSPLSGGVLAARLTADLTTARDQDVFRFVVPLGLGGVTVRVQTLGLSLLAPRLTVYDAAGTVVSTVTSSGPSAGNLEIRLDGLQLLKTYYVKVEDAPGTAFGVGSYRLSIDSLPGATGLVNTVGGVVEDATALLRNDLHTNDSFLTATLVPPLFTTTSSRFDLAYRASVSDGWDVDFYRITAPAVPAGSSNVITVMAWGLQWQGLAPQVTVFNTSLQAVEATVLVNEHGAFTIQVPNVVSGAAYFVKLEAAPESPKATGNYFLGVDFGQRVTKQAGIAAGSFSGSKVQALDTWTITQTRLVHFSLAAKGTQGDRVRLTIADSKGKTIYQGTANAGQTITTNLLLTPGKYQVSIVGLRSAGSSGPLDYALASLVIDGPIGPQSFDTTSSPSGGSGSGGGSSGWWYGGSGSTNSNPEPYSDPYSNT